MYVCVYVGAHKCVYIYVCVCVCMSSYVLVHISTVHMRSLSYLFSHIQTLIVYVCVHVGAHKCVCVCMSSYVLVHISTVHMRRSQGNLRCPSLLPSTICLRQASPLARDFAE